MCACVSRLVNHKSIVQCDTAVVEIYLGCTGVTTKSGYYHLDDGNTKEGIVKGTAS